MSPTPPAGKVPGTLRKGKHPSLFFFRSTTAQLLPPCVQLTHCSSGTTTLQQWHYCLVAAALLPCNTTTQHVYRPTLLPCGTIAQYKLQRMKCSCMYIGPVRSMPVGWAAGTWTTCASPTWWDWTQRQCWLQVDMQCTSTGMPCQGDVCSPPGTSPRRFSLGWKQSWQQSRRWVMCLVGGHATQLPYRMKPAPCFVEP